MALTAWTDVELCIDADLVEFETNVLQWTGARGVAKKWREKAKDIIGQKIDLRLRTIEIATDAAEVKDLLGNPEVFKDSACYRTLHLIANDASIAPGDLYDRKAEMYLGLYDQEIENALALLHIDTDESGTIEDEEKYNAPTGITLKHGG